MRRRCRRCPIRRRRWRWRGRRTTRSPSRSRKRPDRFQGLAAVAMQDPDRGDRGARARDQAARLQGRAGQRLLADRRSRQRGLLRPAAVPAVLGRGRAARRAVLSAPAQPAAARRAALCRPSLDDGRGLGVRQRNGGACAAADRVGAVRRASASSRSCSATWARTSRSASGGSTIATPPPTRPTATRRSARSPTTSARISM